MSAGRAFEAWLERLPMPHWCKVFVGTGIVLGIGLGPILAYKYNKQIQEKPGHDLFSSEKPEEIQKGMDEAQTAKYKSIVDKNR